MTISLRGESGSSHRFPVRLLDLSRNGIELRAPVTLPLHEALSVDLMIDQPTFELRASAKTCWIEKDSSGGCRVGCSFQPAIPAGLCGWFEGGEDSQGRAAYRSAAPLGCLATKRIGSDERQAVVKEYSESGFCLGDCLPAVLGERIHLLLENPTHLVIAKVLWQLKAEGKYSLGCEFLNPRDLERMEAACKAREFRCQPA